MVELKCPNCGKVFSVEKGQSFLQKGNEATFCSRKCNGIFCRYAQLHGRTPAMQKAISENLVREYNSLDNSEQTDNNGMRRDYTPSTCDGEDIVQPANPEMDGHSNMMLDANP